jgi:YHS domain-containing protein
LATILFKDGAKPEFHTPKHAFQYYLNLQEYSVGKYRTADVDSFFVHDYFTREKISAFTASYLAGSDIRSPMGLDLIPMAEDSIRKLIPVHGGRNVSFGEIDKKLLTELQKGKPIEAKLEAKNATDPVCGMTVNVGQATSQGLVAQYQGKTYYFCQAFDRDRFVKDPAKFVK